MNNIGYLSLALFHVCVLLTGVLSLSLNKILLTAPRADYYGGTRYGNTSSNKVYTPIASHILYGIQQALQECRYQFRWDRWNCPETASSVLSWNSMNKVNRETAFLQAMSTAGVVYYVTKNCSLGSRVNNVCSCTSSANDLPGGRDWEWGGCSDNVRFGEMVATQFFGIGRESTDIETVLQQQNKQAGNRAVRRTFKRLCKCHGITGSCTMRTCWRQVTNNFREIGNFLRKRFKKSKHLNEVGFQNENEAKRLKLSGISKYDLVYMEKSPNYCVMDNSLAYFGTFGRECKRRKKGVKMTKWERNSCRRLCTKCGYKVKKVNTIVTDQCDCKFQWCCNVICQQCVKKITKYYCSHRIVDD